MFSIVLAELPNYSALENEVFGDDYRFGGSTKLVDFFNLGIVNIVFFVAGLALLFYLITSGLSMMTSRGDPKALEGAKARITQALIGFFLIFCAYWIVQIIGLLLGLGGFDGIFGGGLPV